MPDPKRPVGVVCDNSDVVIICALMHDVLDGHERVVVFESYQLKDAVKNYHVHDKEVLAMKYALVESSVHLLISKSFVIYLDHASLLNATQSPHISQRIAC